MSFTVSNINRREYARIEVEKKLVVLRKYVLEGIPSGAFVPLSVTQFRKWVDNTADLKVIGSPNTLNSRSSPHNQDKIDEMLSLLEKVKRLKRRPKKPRPPAAETILRLNQERNDLEKVNAALTSRIHELRAELESQKQLAEQQKNDVNILSEETSKLRKKLSALTAPSKRISRVK